MCLREVEAVRYGAKVAGAYFPDGVSPAELMMSVTHGTRIRTERG